MSDVLEKNGTMPWPRTRHEIGRTVQLVDGRYITVNGIMLDIDGNDYKNIWGLFFQKKLEQWHI